MYKVQTDVLIDIKKLLTNIVIFESVNVKDQKEAERLLNIIKLNYHV